MNHITDQDRGYLKTLSVLLVEDDDISRELLADYLATKCAAVNLARNGAEGFESFVAHTPSIVVTDIQMPAMDGLTMAEKIRSIAPRTPIVVTTAFEHSNYLHRAIEIGIDKYVLKPIARELLLEALLDCSYRLRLEFEQKIVAERLLQAEKNESIGELAGGVAHHFNNLLQIISGYSGLMLMNLSADDPNRENINMITGATNRAATITQGLLTFSRKLPMRMEKADINEIVRHLAPALSDVLGDGIAVKISLSETPALCKVDQEQIRLVLKNLASNSRNAMPEGGVFSLEISHIEIDDEFTRAYGYGEPGLYTLISVSDNGVGIDRDVLHHVINPFYTTREIGQGVGLGLPVSLGIIKTHDGFLNIYSEPGKGTTIRIYLPELISAQQEGLSPKQHHDAPAGGSETILVVDDAIELLKFTAMLLEKFGYRVLVADSGKTALEKFSANCDTIGLVLSDMYLQDMTGSQLAKEVEKTAPGIKFIFTSGYTSDVIRGIGALEATAELICKPVRPYDLLDKIRKMLDAA